MCALYMKDGSTCGRTNGLCVGVCLRVYVFAQVHTTGLEIVSVPLLYLALARTPFAPKNRLFLICTCL